MPRGLAAGPWRPAGVRSSCLLRMATHNVKGLLVKNAQGDHCVTQLVQQWAVDLKLHVVCLQETHITSVGQQQVVQQLINTATQEFGCPTYKAFWGATDKTDSHAGVGILIRADLMGSDAPTITLHPVTADGPLVQATNRSIRIRFKWAGHDFALHNVYLPSGASSHYQQQRDFISNTIKPWLQQLPASVQPVLCGDFNFVENQPLDRRPFTAPRGSERATAAYWAEQMSEAGQVVDAFRALHPHKTAFSFCPRNRVLRRGQRASLVRSRLDRFYVGHRTLTHVHTCKPDSHPAISDHRPVVMHIRPITPPARARGLTRLRLGPLARGDGKAKLRDLVQRLAAEAPTQNPNQLIDWWPHFKQRLTRAVRQLIRHHSQQLAVPSEARKAAEEAWKAAEAALLQAPGDRVAACTRRATTAQAALAAAIREDVLPVDRAARFTLIQQGERPCPLLSQLMQGQGKTGAIPALTAERGGGVICDGPALAEHTVTFFANISSGGAPTPDQLPFVAQCRQEVLAAVAQKATPIPAEAAAGAGRATIGEGEVRHALKRTFAGKSPGPDGIPTEVWRWCKDQLATLLASLFTAIFSTNRLPAGFNNGAITAIYKGKGDNANLANYRPITLLNTDYRILAKVLAIRWGPALGKAIGLEQTAFLPGRLIGENVMFMQMLPDALRAQINKPDAGSQAGAVAFLDFQKAYDTVSRDFLFQVMEAVGASQGMISWAKLLLSNTRAVAAVNGHVSTSREWVAGVRQGCPLAPLMYLFIAWALSCWLQTQPAQRLGMQIAGTRVLCSQYADDVAALLADLSEPTVRCLVAAMDKFATASGQHLNLTKCCLLPVGKPAPDPPPERVCGIKVVPMAETLGIQFTNAGPEANPSGAEWQVRLAKVERCYNKIARLPLSMFGRAFAASTYGVSKLLYHAEYNTVPADITAKLHAMSAKLVDRKLGPNQAQQHGRRLPGIPSSLLVGSPPAGGVGMIPWQQHIAARHAIWAKRLLEALVAIPLNPNAKPPVATPPWVLAAVAVLRQHSPPSHPAFTLLTACTSQAAATSLPSVALRRATQGMLALGPPSTCDPARLPATVGDWCTHVPLWSHPLLELELPLAERPRATQLSLQQQRASANLSSSDMRQHKERDKYGFAGLMYITPTLGELVALNRRLSVLPRPLAYNMPAFYAAVRPGCSSNHDFPWEARSILQTPSELCTMVHTLLQCLPSAWVQRASSAPQPHAHAPGTTLQAVVLALRGLAWPVGMAGAMFQEPRHIIRQSQKATNQQPGPSWSQWEAPCFKPSYSHLLLFREPRPLSVRWATRLQLADWRDAVVQSHSHLVMGALALEPDLPLEADPAAFVQAATAKLRLRLAPVWRLKWENKHKEIWWRLLLGGVVGAGGHGIALRNQHCPCGWTIPTGLSNEDAASAQRDHVFWFCTPARAVRAWIAQSLPQGSSLQPRHLWLLQNPPRVHHGVWWVVALAALTAIDRARKHMWQNWKAQQQQAPADGLTQLTLAEAYGRAGLMPLPPAAPRVTIEEAAARRAVADTAASITDFVNTGILPHGWCDKLQPNHCFIGCRREGDSVKLMSTCRIRDASYLDFLMG